MKAGFVKIPYCMQEYMGMGYDFEFYTDDDVVRFKLTDNNRLIMWAENWFDQSKVERLYNRLWASLKDGVVRVYDTEWYVECEDCGCIEDRDNSYYCEDENIYVCESCYDDHFFTCDDCGEIFRRDYENCVYNHRGEWTHSVCNRCSESERYLRCSICGELHSTDDMRSLGRNGNEGWICDYCYDHGDYYTCEDCGNAFRSDEGSWDNEGDYWYCDSCYESRFGGNRDYSQTALVRQYHRHPDINFLHNEGEMPKYYIGAEIETERGNYDKRQEITDRLGSHEKYIYMMHDGSLCSDGIENIIQPMSPLFFEDFDFETWMQELRDAGARSHNTNNCGLHIHLSRTILGTSDYTEQCFIVGKIQHFLSFNQKMCEKFSRRESNSYAQYQSAQFNIDDLPEVKRQGILQMASGDRYKAINNTNHNTIEFRIFRGTLIPSTFRATVDFCVRVVEFCKWSGDDVDFLTWDRFCTFKPMGDRLKNYMRDRGIKIDEICNEPAEMI